jgi:hypothetical protein
MPQGWFHGYLSVRINNFAAGVSNDVPSFFVIAKARTQPRWYWRTPTNFFYGQIEFEFGRNPATELVKLELSSLAYLRGNDSGTLTSELLARWIAEDDAQESNAQLERETAWIIEFFQRAYEGTAPGPRHSMHFIEDGSFQIPPGIHATLYHWRLGGGIWWLDAIFVIGIAAGTIWFLRRRKLAEL